jgi:hypothetical protein
MNSTQTSIASASVGIILAYCLAVGAGAQETSQKKLETVISGAERAAAMNKTFTNGTPMSAVVAILGTNYTQTSSISIPGPQPRRVSGLIYRFAEQEIVIASTAATNTNPISGTFISAAYLKPGTYRVPKNYIHIGQDGAANWSQAVRQESNSTSSAAGEELSRIWLDRSTTVRQRADAVNRAFTNGTPVSAVVATLGTNYTLCMSSARVWMGPGPEPPNTLWLSYRFGEEEVTIGTSAVLGRDLDALTGKFTGAGHSLPVRPSTGSRR